MTHEMVGPQVYPSYQIVLCEVLAVEELVKVDLRRAREVLVPH